MNEESKEQAANAYYAVLDVLHEIKMNDEQYYQLMDNLRTLRARVFDLELELVKEQDKSRTLEIQLNVWKS